MVVGWAFWGGVIFFLGLSSEQIFPVRPHCRVWSAKTPFLFSDWMWMLVYCVAKSHGRCLMKGTQHLKKLTAGPHPPGAAGTTAALLLMHVVDGLWDLAALHSLM